IYRAGAKSHRALQLAEAFPALALAIYCPHTAALWKGSDDGYYTFSPEATEAEVRQYWERLQEATNLVERGARLRDVAAVMQIPMALRRVKPGAAHMVVGLPYWVDPKGINPQWIISHMPNPLPRMRVWLCAVRVAHGRAGSDFAEWIARHVSLI